MTKQGIPIDEDGYSVNVSTGTIHTRYAEHGNGVRTRTVKGAKTLLNGQPGKACKVCYEYPRYVDDTPRPPQQRRSGKTWREAAIEANAQLNSGEHPILPES